MWWFVCKLPDQLKVLIEEEYSVDIQRNMKDSLMLSVDRLSKLIAKQHEAPAEAELSFYSNVPTFDQSKA